MSVLTTVAQQSRNRRATVALQSHNSRATVALHSPNSRATVAQQFRDDHARIINCDHVYAGFPNFWQLSEEIAIHNRSSNDLIGS